MKEKIKILAELTKIRITFFVSITTVFGYICYLPEFSGKIFAPIVGLLLLASGSAVINHIQEHETDAKMDRTKFRPIPSKRITMRSAIKIATLLVLFGSALLITVGIIPFFLGMLNLFWYNVVYTPLKKISPIAIIPGSLVGAIPPAVGWTSAGGSLLDPQILVISFFFFIWQIPHFWLLLLVLSKDYEKAGFPTLSKIFNDKQLSRITFIWIIATVVSSFLIPLYGIIKNPFLYIILLAAGIWITRNASKLLNGSDQKLNFKFAFREINIFALVVMLIISLDQLLISL